MVVLPFELAKSIIEPIQGHSMFDLKENADTETVERLNKALNKQDGDEEKDKKKKKLQLDTLPKTPSETPEQRPPYPPRRLFNQKNKDLTRTQLRTKLQKTASFDLRTLEVFDWEGRPIKDSNIDRVLDHAYGVSSSRHPPGSREVASRLRLLEISQVPNDAFSSLITTPVKRSRRLATATPLTPTKVATSESPRKRAIDRRVTRSWRKF